MTEALLLFLLAVAVFVASFFVGRWAASRLACWLIGRALEHALTAPSQDFEAPWWVSFVLRREQRRIRRQREKGGAE